MKIKQIKHPLTKAMALAFLSLTCAQAQAADYSFTDLGTAGGPYSGVWGINNANQSTGYNSRGTPSEDQGWILSRWDGTTMNLISDPGRFNAGWGINSSGVIAGGSSRAFVGYVHAAIWNSGTRTDLIDLGGATDPNDNRWSIGAGINDAGQVIGSSVTADQSATKAVLWNNSVDPTILSTLGGASAEGNGINNNGQAVGDSYLVGDAVQHAALWNLNSDNISDLGSLGGTNSSALAINTTGQIVGWSDIAGDAAQHAVTWNGAVMSDLGTLGGINSQALALNDTGTVVGWSEQADGAKHATLWQANQVIDLNSLLDPGLISTGWVLKQAAGINNNGWIVGSATNSLLGITDSHAFLLVPTAVPLPGTMWLFGSVLAGLLGSIRQRT